jgi:translocation and assembly module TamB
MSQISPAQGLQIAGTAASLAGGGDIDVLSKLRTGLGLDRLTLGQAGGSSFASGVPGIGATPGSTAPTGLGTAPLAAGSGAAAGGVAGTTVSAGKYVANGVYVGVNQGLQAGSSTVTVDIDVSRHISIETQAGQQSGTGLGVNWKLDY